VGDYGVNYSASWMRKSVRNPSVSVSSPTLVSVGPREIKFPYCSRLATHLIADCGCIVICPEVTKKMLDEVWRREEENWVVLTVKTERKQGGRRVNDAC
jgi:hypothetical protein